MAEAERCMAACEGHMVSPTRSPMDGRLFLAYPHDSGALSQSFDKLQLSDDGGSDLVSVSAPVSPSSASTDLFCTLKHSF